MTTKLAGGRQPARLRQLSRRTLLTAGALAMGGGGCEGGSKTGGGSSRDGALVLVFGSQGDIHALSADARAGRQLTKVAQGGLARDPTWTPDGARIAYAYSSPLPLTRGPGGLLPLPITDLYVMNPDGSDQKVLVAHQSPGESLDHPVWAPDGKSLLVTYSALVMESNIVKDQIVEIARVYPDGRTRATIVPDAAFPALSPDGKRLAYVTSGRDGSQGLMLADVDGKNKRPLLSAGHATALYLSALAAPRFSPDGKQVMFTAAAPLQPGVAPTAPSMAITPSPPRRAAAGATALGEALLSIVLPALGPRRAAAHGLPADLFAVRTDGAGADGSGLRRLTQIGEDSPSGTWSPDGTQVAFVAAGGIYLTKSDGSSFANAISTAGGHGLIDWRRG